IVRILQVCLLPVCVSDVDECVDPLQCPGQECVNTPGSYRCSSCQPGFGLLNGLCTDVDECVRSGMCSDGRCVNTEGSFECQCETGFTTNPEKTACLDEDECVSQVGVCGSARCENTQGSFTCKCDGAADIFDSSTRQCVSSVRPGSGTLPESRHSSSSSSVSSGFQISMVDVAPMLQPHPATRPGELRECYYNLADQGVCSLLAANTSRQECCCTMGEGWGLDCQYHACPLADTASPYSPEFIPPGELPGRDFSRPDYEDYPPAGGSRSGFRGRPPVSFGQPDEAYRGSEFRAPTFRLPPDPRSDIAFGAQPLSPSRPDSSPRNPAPLPGSSYEDREEEEDFRTWRPGSHFPPFDRSTDGGGSPRRVYERRYETHAGLNAAEDCGILHGCENGQCIRVAEGYTCDCYQGFELDMTSMTCIDINECEDIVGLQFPCVNARCVNTEGSFRCVCRRGYVMSRRRNHCIAA
ncbi:hypothetical protein XENOCAPTIV_025744, partial [Xenoophorus captivus]